MENLESIEKLRQENKLDKQEIDLYLDQLVQAKEYITPSLANSPSESNYITELCKYEQQISHKLTEIKCELKKFVYLNKPPICKPTRRKSVVDSIDIEILKQNSWRLISKLEEYADKDQNKLRTNNSGASSINSTHHSFSSEVQYPYVSESTMEKLSGHTKYMLKDLSTPKNLNCTSENISIANNMTTSNNFPEKDEKIHVLNGSSLSSMLNSNSNLPNCELYPNPKDIKLELLNICKVEQSDEVLGDDSVKPEHSSSSSCKELKTNHDKQIESFFENTSEHLKINSPSNSKANNENCLMDFQVEEITKYSKFNTENFEKESVFSSLSNSVDVEKAKSFETDSCKEVSNAAIKTDSLIDLEDYSTIFKFKHDSKIPEVSILCTEPAMLLSTKENVNPRVTSDCIQIIKLNNDVSSSYVHVSSDIMPINSDGHSMDFETVQCEQQLNLKQLKEQSCISKNQILNDTRLKNNLTGNSIDLVEDGLKVPEQFKSKTKENVKDANLRANMVTPFYSAQDKILKLGLEDRMTRFEKTRNVAFLPDLRLQPSVRDNGKLNQILHRGAKFELLDKEIRNLYVTCVFSHVESPFEFYIHLYDEESQLIDPLNHLITQHYQKSSTPYKSKFEAFEKIGKFCCAYVRDDKTYYRAEVLDWLFDKDTKIVLVQLVDYGNITPVHYKHLRELTKEFSIFPKLAVRCYFPMMYPPGSTKENILNEWPIESIEALRDLGGLSNSNEKIFYKIFYVQKEEELTGVDMYEEGSDELNSVGQLLIDLGHAVQIILPSDDPMGIVCDNEDIERLEECENINEVVLGYDPKDERRICKFTRKDGTCFKGKNCKLEHLQFIRGGYTNDHILTFCSAINEIVLPQQAESVPIRFTVFRGASHYYIHLMQYADSLMRLEKLMNDKQKCSTYKQYKIMPAYGEIVLIKHWCKRWMRGKVRHHSYDDEGNCTGVQAFMVDYGDIIDVCLKDVRHIKPEFLDLPFQAVECILYNYKARNDVDIKEVDKFFYDNMCFREFIGQVMGRSNMLLLKVFYKNRDIGEILSEHGFLTKVGTQYFASDNSIVIPG